MSLLIKALDKAEKDQAQFGKPATAEADPKLNTEKNLPASEWALTSIQDDGAGSATDQLPNVTNKETAVKRAGFEYGRQKPRDAFDANNIDVNSLAEFGLSSANLKNSPNKVQHNRPALSPNVASQLNEQVIEQAKIQAEQDVVSANQRNFAANVFAAKQSEPKNINKIALVSFLALASLFFVSVGGYAYFVDHSILNGTPLNGLFAKSNPTPQINLAQKKALDTSHENIATPLPIVENNYSFPVAKVAEASAAESVATEPPAAGNMALKNQTANTVLANDLVTQSVENNPANRIAQIDVPKKVINTRKSRELELNELANDASSFNQNVQIADKPNTAKSQKALLSSRSATITVTKNKPVTSVSPTLQSAYFAYTVGEDAKAQQLYKQVLQTETRNVDAMLGLAAIAQKQNRMDDATGWYRKVIELDPKNPFAQASLASNTLNTQSLNNGQDDAVANESRLKNLIAQQPDNASLQAALGSLYADQNQWPSAQQAYFEAYRLAPNNADFAFNLAASLDQMGKPKLALPYYKRALEQQLKSGNSQVDIAAIKARIDVIQ